MLVLKSDYEKLAAPIAGARKRGIVFAVEVAPK